MNKNSYEKSQVDGEYEYGVIGKPFASLVIYFLRMYINTSAKDSVIFA